MKRFCLPAAVSAFALALGVLSSGDASDEFLINGGFETGSALAWTTIDANLEAVAVPHCGNWAGHLSSDGVSSSIETHQRTYLSGYRTYELSGCVPQDAPSITTSLRIVWFNVDDQLVGVDQSPVLLDSDPSYRHLTTGQIIQPLGATRLQAEVSVHGLGSYSIIRRAGIRDRRLCWRGGSAPKNEEYAVRQRR